MTVDGFSPSVTLAQQGTYPSERLQTEERTAYSQGSGVGVGAGGAAIQQSSEQQEKGADPGEILSFSATLTLWSGKGFWRKKKTEGFHFCLLSHLPNFTILHRTFKSP